MQTLPSSLASQGQALFPSLVEGCAARGLGVAQREASTMSSEKSQGLWGSVGRTKHPR